MPLSDSLVAKMALGDVRSSSLIVTVNISSVSKGSFIGFLFNDDLLLSLDVLLILWLLLSLLPVAELDTASSEVAVAATLKMMSVSADIMQLQ